MNTFTSFSVGLVILLLLVFGVLQFLHIPTGSFLDWVIGGASFWWLMLIVTVPWNIHFEAKRVLAEARESQQKGISVDEQQIKYVNVLAERSLWVALGLHLLSAIVLYILAAMGISAIGYISSVAALMLTLARPAISAYQYLATRLAMIRQQFVYPRADVMELRDRVANLESSITQIERELNPDHPHSWRSQQAEQLAAIHDELTRLASTLADFKSMNQAEHTRLARDAEGAIAKLSTDSQFLNHVREIIRFFKET